ncbi:MAG: hypothetical protein GY711_19150 [bacterium]|nr:hypothetical protein [bacterium]
MKLFSLLSVAALSTAPALAQWTIDDLSQARREIAITAVGDTVVFAGGFLPSGISTDRVDFYNTTTEMWTTGMLSVSRGGAAATTVGTKVIIGGGADVTPGGMGLDTVDIWDSATNTWTTSNLSFARFGLTATTVGTKAMFAGGFFTDVVDIYDDATGMWSTALLSVTRGDLAATSVGNLAIFAGGWDGGSNTDVVDIFDDSTGTWTATTLSVPRSRLAATTVGSEAIFAGGGSTVLGDSTAVDIYNDSTGMWTTAALSEPREFLGAATAGGTAIFAGGWNGVAQAYSATADLYTAGTWTTSAISIARWGIAGAGLQNEAYFGGGIVFGRRVDIYTETGPIGTSYCGPAIPNSTGGPSTISANGTTSVGLNNVTLTADGLPPGEFGYFLAGQTQGFLNPPGSQGVICLSGNIGRYNSVADIIQGPTGDLTLDLTSIPVNPPQAAAAGDTWYFQCWHRDTNPTSTSNFTDGVTIVFTP